MALQDDTTHALLDLLLGTSGVLPATVYIGLMTQAPAADGTGVLEPGGFGYARVAVTNDVANWPAASNREKAHANDIVFPAAAGGSWGIITHAGIFTTSTLGAIRAVYTLDSPRSVLDGDIFRFLAASNPARFSLPYSV